MAKNARGGRYRPAPEGAISPVATSYSMAHWSSCQVTDPCESPSATPQSTHILGEDLGNFTSAN